MSTNKPRYELQQEIARGGMGVVVRGRDVELDRELAFKIVHSHLAKDPVVIERFLQEARVCGQLQHPGIVPIHEIGTLSDGRPFFAMKLVRGETLAAQLRRRADDDGALGHFLGVFEDVCHAVAFAHNSGIIHRDLKPSNIMVGEFGEVQVMDWGIAKRIAANTDLANEENRDPKRQPEHEADSEATDPAFLEETRYIDSVVARGNEGEATLGSQVSDGATDATTAPSGWSVQSAGSSKFEQGSIETHTHAGTVLGTATYMPPEQAVGDLESMDARSDVFGLGAILCEIITGRPPYSRDPVKALLSAAGGDLEDAFRKLRGSNEDPQLVALAESCLQRKAADRLADGAAVAREVSDYLRGVQEREKQAVLDAAESRARAGEERKRRRSQLVLGSILLIAVSVGALVSANMMFRAVQAEKTALSERDAKDEALSVAKEERQKADKQWRRSRATLVTAQLARARSVSPLEPIRALDMAHDYRSCPIDERGLGWNLFARQTARWVYARWSAHSRPITAMAMSYDGKTIATSSGDNSVSIWRLRDQTLVKTLNHAATIAKIAFHPKDFGFWGAGSGGKISYWKDYTKSATPLTFTAHPQRIRSLQLDATGQWLATGGEDSTVKIWKTAQLW